MTSVDMTILIGGEAGQGIQTVGLILAQACQKAGLYVMAVNDFESRIRGGHSFFQMRTCDRPVHAPQKDIQLLVALDDKSIDIHKEHLAPKGRILFGSNTLPEDEVTIPISFVDLAKDAGGKIMANTVAAGACSALMGSPFAFLERVLSDHFGSKADQLLTDNLKAARFGYDAAKGKDFAYRLTWPKNPSPKGRLLDGAEAIALGALAGDCRFGTFYPMSPATGIMGHLVAMSPKFPLVIEQAEDEIAAVNMAIGASFAGVRAMTATSGGGFCLMTEGLGLAAMTETPIVIVDGQRPGPSTGLPTRTGQGDLSFVISASQDDFPRFVFAPSSPDDAYIMTAKAFDLADKYQVPAILLADQFLLDSLFTVEQPLHAPDTIVRYTVTDAGLGNPDTYQRYKFTKNGISPRALPCAGKALVMISSDEHDEKGHISEEIRNRIEQMDKRFAKHEDMRNEMRPPEATHPECDLMLVSWGSSRGAVSEAVSELRKVGVDAGHAHFTDIWPFPRDAAAAIIGKAKRFFMVEQNYTSQMGKLIRQETGLKPSGFILKYDGRPLYPKEIISTVQAKLR